MHVLTVLPGTVYTKMTIGLKLPKLFTTYPNKVANDIFNAVIKKKYNLHNKNMEINNDHHKTYTRRNI